MKTTDFRDVTWGEIQGKLKGARAKVYHTLMICGPCTTATLADWAEMSILTVRPRITELCQMGLARLAADQPRGHEGVYETVSLHEAELAHRDMQQSGRHQLEMRLQA